MTAVSYSFSVTFRIRRRKTNSRPLAAIELGLERCPNLLMVMCVWEVERHSRQYPPSTITLSLSRGISARQSTVRLPGMAPHCPPFS
eukprot:18842_6